MIFGKSPVVVATILAVVALLLVQANCDLALPGYTSDIVDVGIQQGGVDSALVDYPGWTRDVVEKEVRSICEACGTKFFIPNTSQGGAMSTYPGVYEAVAEEIDKMSKELFK